MGPSSYSKDDEEMAKDYKGRSVMTYTKVIQRQRKLNTWLFGV